MTVKVIQRDGVNVFQVNGEINISTSPELRKSFETQPSKKIVVDLEKVSYIDSSGLATLVEILKKTKMQGGSLGLSGLSEKVRSLFEITKLDKLFSIHPTLDAAVEKVR
ncbi:MAG: putative anti-sigma factor antagonist [Candidatus Omnitrophica bacterium]|nr:putative anti-sigma factor antagonist [Candidatus Omnitrophota bacterium]